MPGQVARAQVHVQEDFRRARRCRRRPCSDDDLLRGLRDGIWCRELRAVALKVFPVEDDALESLLVALFELACLARRRCRLRLVDRGGFPFAIGAGQRGLATSAPSAPASTARAPTVARQSVGDLTRRGERARVDLPALVRRDVLQPVVVRPAQVRDVLVVVPDPARLGGRIRRNDPTLRPAAVRVGLLETRRYGKGDPLAVRRQRVITDGLDPIVVFDSQCAAGCWCLAGCRNRSEAARDERDCCDCEDEPQHDDPPFGRSKRKRRVAQRETKTDRNDTKETSWMRMVSEDSPLSFRAIVAQDVNHSRTGEVPCEAQAHPLCWSIRRGDCFGGSADSRDDSRANSGHVRSSHNWRGRTRDLYDGHHRACADGERRHANLRNDSDAGRGLQLTGHEGTDPRAARSVPVRPSSDAGTGDAHPGGRRSRGGDRSSPRMRR